MQIFQLCLVFIMKVFLSFNSFLEGYIMFRIVNFFLFKYIAYLSAMIFIFISEASAQSLSSSLANAYNNHPLLASERSEERVVTEDIAEALAGWKPVVYLDASIGKSLETLEALERPWIGSALDWPWRRWSHGNPGNLGASRALLV